MLDHLEVSGHVFEHLAAVFAEPVGGAAAVRADRGRRMDYRLARQMARQPATCRPDSLGRPRLAGLGNCLGSIGSCRRHDHCLARLDLLDGQFELADLARQPLRRPAELLPAQLVELHLQLLELERLELQRFEGEIALGKERAHHLPQAVNVFRKSGSFVKHINMLP